MDLLVRRAIEDAGGKPQVHVSTSAEGRIYILNAAGRIWSADGRLLHLNHAKQCVARCLTTASRSREPDCTFTAHGMSASSGGDILLIRGSIYNVRSLLSSPVPQCLESAPQACTCSANHCLQETEDLSYARLYLVDVAAARPTGLLQDTSQASSGSTTEADWQEPSLLVETCQTHSVIVDGDHLSRLPHLDILRVRSAYYQYCRVGPSDTAVTCMLRTEQCLRTAIHSVSARPCTS
jgi:hypothetical protein